MNKVDREEAALADNEIGVLPQVVAANIKAQHPEMLQFLTEPANVVWLTTQYGDRALPLEQWFNKMVRTANWEVPFLCAADAAAEHGVGWLYVEHTKEHQSGFKVKFVQNRHFALPKGCEDIQRAAMLGYAVKLSVADLRTHAQALGFRAEWENEFDLTPQTELHEYRTAWHMYYRDQSNTVMCFWFSGKKVMTEPKPLQFFISADGATVPYTQYPFVPCQYETTSELEYDKMQGRSALDAPEQIAIQALQTAGVNGALNAARSIPFSEDKTNLDFEQKLTLKPGVLANKRIEFMQPNFPPMHVFNASAMLRNQNAQSAGHTDIAMAGQSYRKSAKEIQLAANISQGQSMLLTSSLSRAVVEVYTMVFEGIKQHYSSGWRNMTLLNALEPEVAKALPHTYILSAAGREEYLKREALLASIEQSFGLISANPVLAQLLQEEYLTVRFPHLATKVTQALNNTPIIEALIETIRALADGNPDRRNELLSFADQASSRLLGVASSSADRTSAPTDAPTSGEAPPPSGGSELH